MQGTKVRSCNVVLQNRSLFVDLRSLRYIFARCNSGQNHSSVFLRRAFGTRGCLRRYGSVKASVKRQETFPRIHQPRLNCVLLSHYDATVTTTVESSSAWPESSNVKSLPAVIEYCFMKPQWKRCKASEIELSRHNMMKYIVMLFRLWWRWGIFGLIKYSIISETEPICI